MISMEEFFTFIGMTRSTPLDGSITIMERPRMSCANISSDSTLEDRCIFRISATADQVFSTERTRRSFSFRMKVLGRTFRQLATELSYHRKLAMEYFGTTSLVVADKQSILPHCP